MQIFSIVFPMEPNINKPDQMSSTGNTPQNGPVPEPKLADSDVDPIGEILNNDGKKQESDEEVKKNGIKSLLSTILILVIAPIIALALTAFVFQSYEVDGPSMETTLQNKDRLIVYKLPKTLSKISRNPYVPNRGDVVIFTRHDNFEFGTQGDRQLIKRVIALPGETVVIKNNVVKVFNEQNPDGIEPDKADYGKVITNTEGDINLKVPENSIFVLGDNRPQSQDSRAFGPVPLDDLVGKLALRVYPFSQSESF